LGIAVVSQDAASGLVTATEPQPASDPTGAALASSFEPVATATTSGIPEQTAPIDDAGGQYDTPALAVAVDEVIAQDDLLGLDLEEDFVTASHREPAEPSTVDLALATWDGETF